MTLTIWSKIVAFCVPCFVMLSGAFILNNEKNAYYSNFYRKSFSKIGIHVLIFSILYVAYTYLKMFFVTSSSAADLSLYDPIISFLKGEPYYHLWYMYMLIGLYAITPLLIKLRQDISFKNFELIALCLIVFCSIMDVTSIYDTSWGVTSFKWIGYYMMGYVIRSSPNKFNQYNSVPFTIIGWGTSFLIAILAIIQNKYELDIPLWQLGSAMHPLTVISSISIFVAFSKYKVSINLSKVTSKVFYIYLLHAIVLEFVKIIFEKIYGHLPDPIWFIPFATLSIFIISYIISYFYDNIYTNITDTLKVSGKVKII